MDPGKIGLGASLDLEIDPKTMQKVAPKDVEQITQSGIGQDGLKTVVRAG